MNRDESATALYRICQERDDARAIARQLADMVRLLLMVVPATEYSAEHALRAFDALPWAKGGDDAA